MKPGISVNGSSLGLGSLVTKTKNTAKDPVFHHKSLQHRPTQFLVAHNFVKRFANRKT
jgi:hypothetical protein